ncbi:hypothetical protein KY326_04835, partial [Candidatus Woesearchaeota archaeon]|nr:hypothetical protein [Candidatus Woesearchaeota archaeon]
APEELSVGYNFDQRDPQPTITYRVGQSIIHLPADGEFDQFVGKTGDALKQAISEAYYRLAGGHFRGKMSIIPGEEQLNLDWTPRVTGHTYIRFVKSPAMGDGIVHINWWPADLNDPSKAVMFHVTIDNSPESNKRFRTGNINNWLLRMGKAFKDMGLPKNQVKIKWNHDYGGVPYIFTVEQLEKFAEYQREIVANSGIAEKAGQNLFVVNKAGETDIPDIGGFSKYVGNKAKKLAEMVNLGLPVPPAVVFSARLQELYYTARDRELTPEESREMNNLVDEAISILESADTTNKRFNDPETPLAVSVRSGAEISMPGLMETILDVGFNDASLDSFVNYFMKEFRLSETESRQVALDSYRRFLESFGRVALEMDKAKFDDAIQRIGGRKELAQFTNSELEQLIESYKQIYVSEGRQDVVDALKTGNMNLILRLAVDAVYNSFHGPKAQSLRARNPKIFEGVLGTAVTVQEMKFGNLNEESGSGVLHTIDPNTGKLYSVDPETGERTLFGDYSEMGQGEDVVAGEEGDVAKIIVLKQKYPEIYNRLEEMARFLQAHYKTPQDIEFTIENGRLYVLQTRAAKLTPRAELMFAYSRRKNGEISPEQLSNIVSGRTKEILSLEIKDDYLEDNAPAITAEHGIPGVTSGRIRVLTPEFEANFEAEMEKYGKGEVILVTGESLPDHEKLVQHEKVGG